MFDDREVVYALPSSSSDSKKLLSGSADVYLAAVVKLPGVPYASLHCGPLLEEDFPVGSEAS